MLDRYLIANYNGKPNEENVVNLRHTRITVLTDRIIRVEKNRRGLYEDSPTEMITNRFTDRVNFTVTKKGIDVYITTQCAVFKITNGLFKEASIDGGASFHNDEYNLGGTVRTLDRVFGPCKLEKGIMSKTGITVLDDSDSLIFNSRGELQERKLIESDVYALASTDYNDLLNDFYLISGIPPILPRFAFGNWWSRYYPYTQEEYISLMDEFRKRSIPLSVSVIDMDWHYVKIKEDFSDLYKNYKFPLLYHRSKMGWTGYTFNKDLFPNPEGFFKELRNRGLKSSLNIHPAQGVFPHEDAYTKMASLVKPAGKFSEVEFDFTNPNYINGYFKYLHKPLEDIGVDFWWIDWQQGNTSKLSGLDPLFALNHYHYLENSENKRGLILSRYFGLGAQRYPVGFSGDTFINWKVLNFIPYFTANAINAGYGMWSHDIGGHMFGVHDDELYARWLQFGCFSPINRLHSSNLPVIVKEPWKYGEDACNVAEKYLRLRNKLVPYIYTEHVDSINGGHPLFAPLYYYYKDEEAFSTPNAYMFGDNLYVLPITHKTDSVSKYAVEEGWLPEGNWIDIFTRTKYSTGKQYFARELKDIPVLLKEGGVLPLSYEINDTNNPQTLELISYSGTGDYYLFEDDGESFDYKEGKFTSTHIKSERLDNDIVYTIKVDGDVQLLGHERNYVFKPIDIIDCESAFLLVNGTTKQLFPFEINGRKVFTKKKPTVLNEICEIIPNEVSILLEEMMFASPVQVVFHGVVDRDNGLYKDNLVNFISKTRGRNVARNNIYKRLSSGADEQEALSLINKSRYSRTNKKVLKEILKVSKF